MTNPFPHLVRDGLDPIDEIQRLRDDPETGGVRQVPNPAGGVAWVVTRHEDVRAVLADPATYSSAPSSRTIVPQVDEENSLLTADPPGLPSRNCSGSARSCR